MGESLRAAAPGERGRRADDHGGNGITNKSNPRPDIEAATPAVAGIDSNPQPRVDPVAVCADRYAAHTLDVWLTARGARPTERRAERWVLSAPRPATFAEALELGALDVEDLAVPVGAVDGVGGGS